MAQPILHGGGLAAARLTFPDAPLPWIDLSTGINPVPYPVTIPLEALTCLPEPEAVTVLEASAAWAYGVANPAMVAAAPGTQSLIHLLPRLMPGRNVAVVGPTYAEHAAAWMQGGGRVRHVTSLMGIGSAEIVVVVNPNNPDGVRWPAKDLLMVADTMASIGGLLIVDEAFADLEAGSLAPCVPRAGLVLLRSFGKAYGLAGVRLGFLLGEARLAAAVRAALGPWAVSGPALWAGQAALSDAVWRTATAERLAEDVVRLDTLLQEAGCQVLGGTRLFRLVAVDDARAAYERLGHAGILVRRFDYNPRWLRFGVPNGAAWKRLYEARYLLNGDAG